MTADPVNDAPLSAVERERKRRGGGEIKSDLHGSLPDTARPPWPETGNSEAASGTGAGRSSALSLSLGRCETGGFLLMVCAYSWLAGMRDQCADKYRSPSNGVEKEYIQNHTQGSTFMLVSFFGLFFSSHHSVCLKWDVNV